MSFEEKDFNDIADELASGDQGSTADEKLRDILGDSEDQSAAGQNVGAGGQTNEPPAAAEPEQAEGSAPDPSLINWARNLWRTPGSSYSARTEANANRESDAVRKEGAFKIIRTVLLTALCLIVGIVAAMQFKTIASRSTAEPDAERQINQLSSTIINLHAELESLEAERTELQNRLDMLEQSSQDEQIAAIREELNNVRTFAGLTSVKGRGIHIQLGFTERTNVSSIQTRLILLINELRASGAQAISINGVRILAMTEMRVVNDQYISVNARQIIAPYDIYAIGDASSLYSGITMGGSGIVYQIRNLAGATCNWDIQENIVIGAANDEDIRTDKLTPNP